MTVSAGTDAGERGRREMSEKTREAFERWYSEYLGSTVSPARIEAAEAAWLSSRRQALEEAAKLCEAEQLDDPTDSADDIAYGNAVRDCASAIRREAEGK